MPTSIQIPNVTPDRLQEEINFWRAGGYQVYTQLQHDGVNYLVIATKDLLGAPDSGSRALAAPEASIDISASRAAGSIRLLCVHGVGHQEGDANFKRTWVDTISAGMTGVPAEIQFVNYDDIFADEDLSGI